MSTSATSTSADAIRADIQEKRTGRAPAALEARRRDEVDRYGGWDSLIMIGGVPLAAGGGGLLFNAVMGFPSISDE